jgi:glycosyltransferase involved in cell wall biosynthesis
MHKNFAISVVIPARNSGDTIAQTVKSVLAQTLPPREVIIVASPGDGTKAPLESFIAQGLVRYFEVEAAGYVRDAHYKRWIGAQEAHGTYVFFTDAKIVLAPDALANAAKLTLYFGVEVIAGSVRSWPGHEHRFIAKVQDKALIKNNPTFGQAELLHRENFGATEHLPVTTGLLMSKRVFKAIKHDFALEYSRVASTYDDYATAWLIVRAGFSILRTSSVVSYHRHRGWRGYRRQIARSGQSAALLLDYYPDCPFGARRRRQVMLFASSHLFFTSLIVATLLGTTTSTLWLIPASMVAGFAIAGIINVLRSKDIMAFWLPPITYLLIATFSYHFIKWRLMRQASKTSLPLKYLQVD